MGFSAFSAEYFSGWEKKAKKGKEQNVEQNLIVNN
jgi:hypothetical protein